MFKQFLCSDISTSRTKKRLFRPGKQMADRGARKKHRSTAKNVSKRPLSKRVGVKKSSSTSESEVCPRLEEEKCDKVVSQLSLNLSDSLLLSGATDAFISPTGDYIWTVTAREDEGPIATLYVNSKGALTPVNYIPFDPAFPDGAAGGASSPSFNRFSLIEESQDGTVRIRLFTPQSFPAPSAARVFPPVNSVHSVRGGLFSTDDRYLGFTYVANNGGFLHILDANSLEDIVVVPIGGYSEGPFFFSLSKDQRSAVSEKKRETWMDGFSSLERIFVAVGWVGDNGPAGFDIYELVDRSLVLLHRLAVPQLIHAISVPNALLCPQATMIAIGFRQTSLDGTVLNGNGEKFPSFTGEPGGFRFYFFDGYSLKMIFDYPLNTSIDSLAFFPTADFITLTQRLTDDSPSVMSLLHLRNSNEGLTFEPTGLPHGVPSHSFVSSFSANGKWFTTAGLYTDDGFRNLQLYSVIAA